MEAWRQTDLFEGEVLLRDIKIDAACSSVSSLEIC